jgi:hypothetical protein
VRQRLSDDRMLKLAEESEVTLTELMFGLEDVLQRRTLDLSEFDNAVGVDEKMRVFVLNFQFLIRHYPSLKKALDVISADLKDGERARKTGINPENMNIRDFVRYLHAILGFLEKDDTGEIEEH